MLLPENFVKRLYAELPEEAESLLHTIIEAKPPVSVRLNPKINGPLDLPLDKQLQWTENAYYLSERPVFTLDPAFHSGAYYVQEASSMVLGSIVKQLPAIKTVLDLCAAPGGKSTLLASCLPDDGVLLANEILPNRAAVLTENLTKWGDERVLVSNNKPADFLKTALQFDLVVCDAPCSGEGLFRRDPDAMKEWTAGSPDKCAVRQQDIVEVAGQLVKSDGFFIYSTCTYAVAENEAIVHRLIAAGWEPYVVQLEQAWGFLDAATLGLTKYTGSMFRAMPHRVRGEGFFIAVLRKTKQTLDKPAVKLKSSTFRIIEPNVPFYNTGILERYIIAKIKDTDYAWTAGVQQLFEAASGRLNFLKCGIRLGKWQGSVFMPDQEAAMSASILSDVPVLELALEEARWYLSRLPFHMRQAEMGWQLVAYQGHRLGWVQQLPDQSRNCYPNAWRIRMSLPA